MDQKRAGGLPFEWAKPLVLAVNRLRRHHRFEPRLGERRVVGRDRSTRHFPSSVQLSSREKKEPDPAVGSLEKIIGDGWPNGSGVRSRRLEQPVDPGRLRLDEFNLEERVGGDPLEPDHSLGVDQERAVERLIFEVVERAVRLEDLKLGIGQHRHGKFDVVGIVLELHCGVEVVGADRDDLGIQRLECLDLLAERLELLHAVGTLAAEEEEEDDILPSMIGQTPGALLGIKL